jgi:heme/copper-type cytochrome/quinol oxidase subunit 2
MGVTHHGAMRIVGLASIMPLLLLACAPGQPGPAILPPTGPVLVARDIAWVAPFLQIPVGQPVTITVDNQDAGVPHGFAIQSPQGQQLFMGEIVAGPAKTAYGIPPLAPGGYLFMCPVHPNMQGKLAVG